MPVLGQYVALFLQIVSNVRSLFSSDFFVFVTLGDDEMKSKIYNPQNQSIITIYKFLGMKFLTSELSLHKKKYKFCGIKFCRKSTAKEKYKLQKKQATCSLLPKDFSIKNGIVILTTKHCLYIAHLFQKALDRLNCRSEIIFEKPIDGYKNCSHIVISPNIFNELPSTYIAVQLEQLSSSKWYNREYRQKLKTSAFILDYSLNNIDFLHHESFDFNQVYYLPMSYDESKIKTRDKEYDILFYGDMSAARRQNILGYLQKNGMKIKILSNVFGEELENELQKAKIVLNIHYYDNALLETTRICEVLSKTDAIIISEDTENVKEYSYLEPLVDFIKTDDKEALLEKLRTYLEDKVLYEKRVNELKNLKQQNCHWFDYYFYRFLLATNNISFDEFYALAGHSIQFKNNFWCLGLPEAVDRHQSFEKDNTFGIEYFSGLRHEIGWIGCGLSYKFMLRKAHELNLPYVKICEDDIEFNPSFAEDIENIEEYLQNNKQNWDIFSGLIADVNKRTQITDIKYYLSYEFLFINKLVSTVFNIYNSSVFSCLEKWDNHNYDTNNTIDRFMENQCRLRVITTNPFLINQKNYLTSTLWQFENSTYDKMIENSENILTEKTRLFYLKEIYKNLQQTKSDK